MKFDNSYIQELADIINLKGLSEITLQEGNQAITIKKENCSNTVQIAQPIVETVSTKEKETVEKGKPITSPMVGTFYTAPSADAQKFVEVGQTVTKGQVVCIIEAMKLMNEIESEYSGKIVEICVENGQPVEFGQVLMYVE